METLPLIQKSELDAATDPVDYLYLFIEKYHQLISADTTGQIQNEFNAEQNVLMAYNLFDGQVCNGGFIQLIENGYGPYVFDSPLSEHLRDWGLAKTADLIDQARTFYLPKREILERKKTLAEFAKLYQEHPEFDPLDSEYYEIVDSERELIKEYIQEHLSDFARIA
jgi:hypothetical protein